MVRSNTHLSYCKLGQISCFKEVMHVTSLKCKAEAKMTAVILPKMCMQQLLLLYLLWKCYGADVPWKKVSQHYRMVEVGSDLWKAIWSNPPCRSSIGERQMPKTRWLPNICKDRDSTTSLGNMLHYLTTLMVKNSLLGLRLNSTYFNSCTMCLVLSQEMEGKSGSLFFAPCPQILPQANKISPEFATVRELLRILSPTLNYASPCGLGHTNLLLRDKCSCLMSSTVSEMKAKLLNEHDLYEIRKDLPINQDSGSARNCSSFLTVIIIVLVWA